MTNHRDQKLARNHEIFRLRTKKRLTYRAIGEQFGITPGAVRQIVVRYEHDHGDESVLILAPTVKVLRAGLLVVIGDPAAELEEASISWPKPTEAFTGPLMRIDAYRALLDLIGWIEPPRPKAVEVRLTEHRWALTTALNDRLKIEWDFAGEHKNSAERRAKAEKHARLIESLQAAIEAK
jgi:hypothetical protein